MRVANQVLTFQYTTWVIQFLSHKHTWHPHNDPLAKASSMTNNFYDTNVTPAVLTTTSYSTTRVASAVWSILVFHLFLDGNPSNLFERYLAKTCNHDHFDDKLLPFSSRINNLNYNLAYRNYSKPMCFNSLGFFWQLEELMKVPMIQCSQNNNEPLAK